tara:strand:+ start:274 stop:462 length:189 start_codon:yes stop_codon:yes gene_type:complete
MAKSKGNSVDIGFSKFLDYATLAFKAVDNRYKDLDIPEVKEKETRVRKPVPMNLDNPFRGMM